MVQQQQSERSIFLEAIEIGGATDRSAFLDKACGGDTDLRTRIDALLQAHGRPQALLDALPPTPTESTGPEPAERSGAVIDQYKLLEQIGEGGFGVVYMAEQTEPVRRKVALKVLKPGMDTRQVVARFEAERQALALMDHPNIAKVLGAGETPSGRPYFVMELVRGVPVTQFCTDNGLAPRQRLELFVSICHAVQHAHQKGVIHRDLKPSNILVTIIDGSPCAKVIDFGVAKAAGQQLTDKTLFTNFAQMIGTPLYMSPEQAALSGVDVDTRSDVYSLGVLLYELLTGTTPFDRQRFKEVGYDEMRRIIREEEPPRPSIRVSTMRMETTAVAPGFPDAKRLSRLCRGELDWIVMKCLEKDRNRRYETSSALAADVRRYLDDEPVQACPPSAWYKLRKFGRRNKVALAVGGLVLILLLALGVTVGWTARERATRRQILEQQVAGALKESEDLYRAERLPQAFAALKEAEGLLAAAGGPGDDLGERVAQWRRDLEMVERLEEIRMRQATVRGGIYQTQRADSDYAEAFRGYGINVETLEPREAGRQVASRAIKLNLVVAVDHWLQVRKELNKAPPEKWRPLLEVVRAADDDEYRNRFRTALIDRDAEAIIRMTQSEHLAKLPMVTALHAADVLRWTKHADEAIELLHQMQRRYPGDFWVNYQLGLNLFKQGPARWEEALRYYSAALAARPDVVDLHLNIGGLLHETGHFEAAAAELRHLLTLQPDRPEVHFALAHTLKSCRREEERLAELRQTVALKADHAEALIELGDALRNKGEFPEALTCLRRGHELGSKRPNWIYQSATMIRDTERLIEFDKRLPDYLSGKARPADMRDRVLLARLCDIRGTGRPAAARWYGEVIAATPALNGDRPAPVRVLAACCAILAAEQETPDNADRSRLRRQARDWLRAELAAQRKRLEFTPTEANFVAEELRHWQVHAALTGVREEAWLAALPADERADWEAFWQETAKLRQRAGGGTGRP